MSKVPTSPMLLLAVASLPATAAERVTAVSESGLTRKVEIDNGAIEIAVPKLWSVAFSKTKIPQADSDEIVGPLRTLAAEPLVLNGELVRVQRVAKHGPVAKIGFGLRELGVDSTASDAVAKLYEEICGDFRQDLEFTVSPSIIVDTINGCKVYRFRCRHSGSESTYTVARSEGRNYLIWATAPTASGVLNAELETIVRRTNFSSRSVEPSAAPKGRTPRIDNGKARASPR